MSENFMKRAFSATLCAAVLVANSVASADSVSDKDMADRYSQAAQSGDSDAEFYLGALYSAGVGRQRSDEEAFQWFSSAAAQGHSHAMLVLGGLYAVGRGTPKSNVDSYKWAYIVSVGSRVDEFRNGSRQLMSVLETKMTAGDVAQAKAEAGRWHAVSSQATLAAPADDTRRQTQPQSSTPASKPVAASTATTPADPGKTPPASDDKKSDLDGLLDKVPSDLRKRLGF
jgi:TPR repeat protein